MLSLREVKGAATDASADDREIPASAAFKAPQSLQPSPHIATWWLKCKQLPLYLPYTHPFYSLVAGESKIYNTIEMYIKYTFSSEINVHFFV